MALPPGITPKTVTVGVASFFDGTLAEGTVTITAPVNVVHKPSNRPILSSQMSKRFVDGETSFLLCPTDAPGLSRVDWTYKMNVVIQGALVQPSPIYFTLPEAGPDVIDLDGLVTVPSSAGTPISVAVLTADDLDGYTAQYVGDADSLTQAALTAAHARAPREHPLPPAPTAPPLRFRTNYNPGFTSVAAPLDASSADVNPALALTFVCPPSGRVRWRLSAAAIIANDGVLQWSLRRNGVRITPSATTVRNGPGAGAGDSPQQRFTVDGELAVDETGAALVPGKQYTVTWGHNVTAANKYGYTRFGGSAGSATMEIEPVIVDPVVSTYTATVAATGFIPEWLCNDRETLLGTVTGPEAKYVCWSTDHGATSGQNPHKFPGAVTRMRQLDNGEVMVGVEAPLSGGNATLWISSGFAADKATATFTQKVQAAPSSAATWHAFSLDTYGPVCLAAEYGPKNGPGNMAGKVWLSEDYGQTWRVGFDLADHHPVTGAHVHGAHYDPWWDALWVTTGDGPNPQTGTWLSLDRGRTWIQYGLSRSLRQYTTVISLPHCILFVTDQEGGPQGIYRVPRVHPRALRWELAHVIDPSTSLLYYGDGASRARSLPDAPALFSIQAGGAAGSGRLYATHDGYTFREAWRDDQTYIEAGLRECYGPTKAGKYVGRVDRVNTSYHADALQLTLTPA